MAIFKRGKTYWFHFIWNGEHIQQSTKQGNPRIARQIEAAYRTRLAKGEVGIVEKKQPAPTLKGFAERFKDSIKVRSAEKPLPMKLTMFRMSCPRWFAGHNVSNKTGFLCEWIVG